LKNIDKFAAKNCWKNSRCIFSNGAEPIDVDYAIFCIYAVWFNWFEYFLTEGKISGRKNANL
jgi:hypothetical protein